MNQQKPEVGKTYIHFKTGKAYEVLNIAVNGDKEVVVYQDKDTKANYIRPVLDFFDDVKDRSDNKTKQSTRFTVEEVFKTVEDMTVDELMKEILRREDCPEDFRMYYKIQNMSEEEFKNILANDLATLTACEIMDKSGIYSEDEILNFLNKKISKF